MGQGDDAQMDQISAAYDSMKNVQTKDGKGESLGKAVAATVIVLIVIIIAAAYIYENGGISAFLKYATISQSTSSTTTLTYNSESNQIIEGALSYSSSGASGSQSDAQSLYLATQDENGSYICIGVTSNSTGSTSFIMNGSIASYYSNKQENQSAIMCSPSGPSKDYGYASDAVIGVYNYTSMKSSGESNTFGQHYYNVSVDYYAKNIVVIVAVCYKNECQLTAPQGCISVQETTTQSTAALAYICKNQNPGEYTFDVSALGGTGVDAEAFVFYK